MSLSPILSFLLRSYIKEKAQKLRFPLSLPSFYASSNPSEKKTPTCQNMRLGPLSIHPFGLNVKCILELVVVQRESCKNMCIVYLRIGIVFCVNTIYICTIFFPLHKHFFFSLIEHEERKKRKPRLGFHQIIASIFFVSSPLFFFLFFQIH